MSIERSRGAIIRFHPSGFRVVMYKDAPGEYVDERGEKFPVAIAKAAGFNVEKLAKERDKQERMVAFKEKLDRDYASEEERLAAALSTDGELSVKHIGGGQYAIYNGASRVTHTALNKTEAEALIEQLTGDDETGDGGSAA